MCKLYEPKYMLEISLYYNQLFLNCPQPPKGGSRSPKIVDVFSVSIRQKSPLGDLGADINSIN